jgi:hypothetical protein
MHIVVQQLTTSASGLSRCFVLPLPIHLVQQIVWFDRHLFLEGGSLTLHSYVRSSR